MKHFLISIILGFSTIIYAQFTLTFEGVVAVNGEVHTFNTFNTANDEMQFNITNNGTETREYRILCSNIVNSDGTNFELCFGACYNNISEGTSYPLPADSPISLAPGESNGNFDHFFNKNGGDGTNYPIDYNFRVFEVDNMGNVTGTPSVNFTYRYDPDALNVTDIQNQSTEKVIVNNTVVKDVLSLKVNEATNMSIYNINGKLISTQELSFGNQLITVSHLQKGVYFLQFNNEKGNNSSSKIMIQ